MEDMARVTCTYRALVVCGSYDASYQILTLLASSTSTSASCRYDPPFDRHDWYVERGDQVVRYVIDFYRGSPVQGKPVSFHLDARPALDSVGACVDRLRMRWSPPSTTATPTPPSPSKTQSS